MNVKYYSVAVLYCMSMVFVSARLEWKETELSLNALPGQEEVLGVFEAKNTGEDPISILEVSTGCSCTIVDFATRVTVEPGQMHSISAVLSLKEDVGTQRKTIVVTTDESDANPYILGISARIPHRIELQPRFLYWSRGGDNVEKSVKVSVYGTGEGQEIKVRSENPAFQIVSEETEIGGKRILDLVVTPTTTSERQRGKILIETENADGEREVHQILTFVK